MQGISSRTRNVLEMMHRLLLKRKKWPCTETYIYLMIFIIY
jgi:hypothetical protein